MAVQDIGSEAAFDATVQGAGDKLVVVDYSTTWCGPCKVIAPKFEELSEKYKDAVFVSVVGDASADARWGIVAVIRTIVCVWNLTLSVVSFPISSLINMISKLMKREGVRSVPSFHFWVNNEKVDVVNGANPEAIEAAITKAMASV